MFANSQTVSWNPDDKGGNIVLSNNNLTATATGSLDNWGNLWSRANVSKQSGKWYWEVKVDNANYVNIGVVNTTASFSYSTPTINMLFWYNYSGVISGSSSITCGTYITGDTIGITLDMDARIVCFYKNGALVATCNNIPTGDLVPAVWIDPPSIVTANFGDTPFNYTIPSGFLPYDNNNATTPAAPINLIATASDASIILSWDGVLDSTGYNVKRSTTAGGPYTTIAENIANTTYTDTSVTNGTTYYYVVTAVNSSAESSNSNEVSATPTESTTPPVGGSNAILEITMVNGFEKEYDLTATELQAFLDWYDGRSNEVGKAYYTFAIKNNVKPFLSRTEYIAYDKILSFEVKDYNE